MTDKEKAKLYDEAIERARNHRDKDGLTLEQYETIDIIFPELKKESKDERIRRRIIHALHGDVLEMNEIKEAVAWIEKQGEQKPYGQREECVDCQCNYAGECKGYCGMKQGEQKSADKVEPKFKVGDWVFIEEVKGYKNGPFQIKTVDSFGYSFDEYHTIPFMYEDILSKWTIQDAKDGDVLATLDYILIFKEFLKNDGGVSYCHYDFGAGNPQFIWSEDKNWYFGKEAIIYPATKEQRDLLFQKMKEAGYEWDAEKKELRKCEDNIVEIDDV